MNEIALFNKNDMIQTQRTLNNDILMSFEGNTATLREGHNIYGMMMSHATYAGLKHISNKRPFVLTRSTFSGVRNMLPYGQAIMLRRGSI
jgi:alpha-glucosidase